MTHKSHLLGGRFGDVPLLSDIGSVTRAPPAVAAAGAADVGHTQDGMERESPGILLLSQATSAGSALASKQCLCVP